jgi:hypothetical protein
MFGRRLRSWLPGTGIVAAATGALLASTGAVLPRDPSAARQIASDPARDFEALPYAPARYVCYRADVAPVIDGRLDDPAWRRTPWTSDFVDIEGGDRARPRLRTRAKMLWDDTYFYVSAEMEEPDVWGTLTDRDAIIYNDNDIEVFIDPDGDTVNYYELEVNPLGTVFDLMLPHTYRDGGPAIVAWDIAGLKLAVDVRGTVNIPGDTDEAWTAEMAIPWRILQEAAPGRRAPRAGEQWRLNFSRVEWPFVVQNGRYARKMDPATGKPTPSSDSTWSPQGFKDIHMPERWGFVQFSPVVAGTGTQPFVEDPSDRVKWALRRLYYRQRRYRAEHGAYARDLAALQADSIAVEGLDFRPSLQATDAGFQTTAPGFNGATVSIRQDGRVWLTR